MNYIMVFIIFFINFVFQTTLLNNVSILGVVPNTTLVFIVVFTFLYKEKYGLFYGLFFGFIQDIFFGNIIGISAFMYFTTALIVYEVKEYIFKDTLLSPVLLMVLVSLYYHLGYWLMSKLFGLDIQFISILKDFVIIEVLYNVLVTIILYKILYRKFYTHRNYS